MTSDPVERYLSRSRRLQQRSVLRPMNGGELLDETLSLVRSTGASLLIPLAMPALVMVAAEAFVGEYVVMRFFETQQPNSKEAQIVEFLANAALGLFGAAPVWIIAMSFATALAVRHAGFTVLGRPSSIGESVRDARRIFPSILRVTGGILFRAVAGFLLSGLLMITGALLSSKTSESSAVAGVVAALGILGLFVGFFWFLFVAGRFGLIAPIAILENARGKDLMRRAVELVKPVGRQSGGTGTIVSLIVTSTIIDLIVSSGLGGILGLLDIPQEVRKGFGGAFGEIVSGALTLAPSVLAHLLVLPYFTISLTVLYFERRVRVEGYDIAALAKDIDSGRRAGGDA